MRKRLLKLSAYPFSSTAPLGEVRYEVPALNVGMRGWPAAARPLKAPGDVHPASATDLPLNLVLVHLVALGAHQGGHPPAVGPGSDVFPSAISRALALSS